MGRIIVVAAANGRVTCPRGDANPFARVHLFHIKRESLGIRKVQHTDRVGIDLLPIDTRIPNHAGTRDQLGRRQRLGLGIGCGYRRSRDKLHRASSIHIICFRNINFGRCPLKT